MPDRTVEGRRRPVQLYLPIAEMPIHVLLILGI